MTELTIVKLKNYQISNSGMIADENDVIHLVLWLIKGFVLEDFNFAVQLKKRQ